MAQDKRLSNEEKKAIDDLASHITTDGPLGLMIEAGKTIALYSSYCTDSRAGRYYLTQKFLHGRYTIAIMHSPKMTGWPEVVYDWVSEAISLNKLKAELINIS